MMARERASRTVSGRSQPEMSRSVAYLRRARAKEPPMRPVPRMVARVIRCEDMSELTVDSLQSKAGKKITHPSAQGKETQRAKWLQREGGVWHLLARDLFQPFQGIGEFSH